MTLTLEIRAVQLRSVTEIAPKSLFLCVNRSPVRNGFCAGVKAIWYSVNIASDRLPDGRQNTPKIWKIYQLYQMAGVTKHATRIIFFYQIHCLRLFRLLLTPVASLLATKSFPGKIWERRQPRRQVYLS